MNKEAINNQQSPNPSRPTSIFRFKGSMANLFIAYTDFFLKHKTKFSIPSKFKKRTKIMEILELK